MCLHTRVRVVVYLHFFFVIVFVDRILSSSQKIIRKSLCIAHFLQLIFLSASNKVFKGKIDKRREHKMFVSRCCSIGFYLLLNLNVLCRAQGQGQRQRPVQMQSDGLNFGFPEAEEEDPSRKNSMVK